MSASTNVIRSLAAASAEACGPDIVRTDAAADGCMAVAGDAVGCTVMNSARTGRVADVAAVAVVEVELWFNVNSPRPVPGLA